LHAAPQHLAAQAARTPPLIGFSEWVKWKPEDGFTMQRFKKNTSEKPNKTEPFQMPSKFGID